MDSSNFFLSPSHQQLYQKLISGFQEGKILVTLTGESGLGKTLMMENIIHELDANTRLIKAPGNNTAANSDFFDTIAKESGIDLSNESTLTEKLACLTRCFQAQPQQHTIIQVDQAQEIKLDTLSIIINWVKLIASEQNHSSYIHIVLIGLPSLNDLLKQSGLHNLEKETICQCNLKPLNDNEILAYINFHLDQSDEDRSLFGQDALERIAFHSKGSPELIDKLCDLGLLTASMNDNPTVTTTVIDEVADNCRLKHITSTPSPIQTTVLDSLLPKADTPDKTTIPPVQNQSDHDTLLNQLLSDKPQFTMIKGKVSENELFTSNQKYEKHSENELSTSTRRNERYSENELFTHTQRNESYSENGLFTPNRRDETFKIHTKKRDRLPTASNTTTTTTTTTTRKSFSAGLLFGVLFSILGIIALNQDWFLDQNKDPSQIQSGNKPEKPEQDLQKIQIAKSSVPSSQVEQDKNLNRLPQPLPDTATQLGNETIQDTTQIPDLGPDDSQKINKQSIKQVIAEPAKPDNLNQRIDKLLIQADQQLTKKHLMTPVDDSAWQTYQEILNLDPGNEQALTGIDKITTTYVLWAKDEIKKGNFQHAKHLFNRALEISPDDSDALSGLTSIEKNNLSSQQQQLSPTPTKETSSEKQQTPNPTEIAEILNKAERQLTKKQLRTPVEDSAWQIYRDILKMDPGNEQALAGIDIITKTYLLWAKDEIKKGNFQHAEYLLYKTLEVSPGNRDALSGLTRLGKNVQSLQQQTSPANEDPLVKQQIPDNTEIVELLQRAERQFAKKQLMTPFKDSAWQTYQEILNLDPGNEHALAGIDRITKIYVLWAREEIEKGNYQQAGNLFNKALEVSPDDKDALSGLNWLKTVP